MFFYIYFAFCALYFCIVSGVGEDIFIFIFFFGGGGHEILLSLYEGYEKFYSLSEGYEIVLDCWGTKKNFQKFRNFFQLPGPLDTH